MQEKMYPAIDKAIEMVRGASAVTVVHHNDTDGLSSGAILQALFERLHVTVQRIALEKPYPEVVTRILSSEGKTVIFADFAGRSAPSIASINGRRNTVVILDHHPPVDPNDASVHIVDGELVGIKGDRDISASATCYLFAKRFLSQEGKQSDDLAHLGVLGAIGDRFLVDGALAGVNREIREEAQAIGTLRVTREKRGESYKIELGSTFEPADTVCTRLDTLGGVGYYRGGADYGVETCFGGLTPRIKGIAEDLQHTRDQLFERERSTVQDNLHDGKYTQWFDVASRFRPMGVKMIGVFCDWIKEELFLDQTRYLAGFQHIPNEIPGFGHIDFRATKVSMRVSAFLTARIRAGDARPLNQLLPAATERIGGFVDACHGLSAATTVPIGEESSLMNALEDEFTR